MLKKYIQNSGCLFRNLRQIHSARRGSLLSPASAPAHGPAGCPRDFQNPLRASGDLSEYSLQKTRISYTNSLQKAEVLTHIFLLGDFVEFWGFVYVYPLGDLGMYIPRVTIDSGELAAIPSRDFRGDFTKIPRFSKIL